MYLKSTVLLKVKCIIFDYLVIYVNVAKARVSVRFFLH